MALGMTANQTMHGVIHHRSSFFKVVLNYYYYFLVMFYFLGSAIFVMNVYISILYNSFLLPFISMKQTLEIKCSVPLVTSQGPVKMDYS